MVLLTGLLHATEKLRTPIALAEAADSSVSWDFDADPPGVLPTGFVVGTLFDGRRAGEWTVHDMKQLPSVLQDMDRRESARIEKLIEAVAAPSPPHVLAQLMNKGYEHDYKVVLVDGTTALVELLERKGVLTRQEIYDAITELRQRHPEATTLERPPRGSIRRPT